MPDNPRVFQPGLLPQAPPPAENGEGEGTTPANEPGQEPVKVFVGGRERTVEEVVRGYEASAQEAMRLRSEREALAAERDALRREADSYRERLNPIEPEVPELGEDASPAQLAAWVAKVAERRAEAIATERVKSVETQFQQFMQAAQQFGGVQAQMKQQDASYDPDKLSAYLSDNPDVQQRYNAIFAVDQAAALEYGWNKAKPALGLNSPGTPPEPSRGVQAPPKRKAPAPTPADAAKERERMLEEAYRTGNYEAYYAWRAKGTSMEHPDLKAQ